MKDGSALRSDDAAAPNKKQPEVFRKLTRIHGLLFGLYRNPESVAKWLSHPNAAFNGGETPLWHMLRSAAGIDAVLAHIEGITDEAESGTTTGIGAGSAATGANTPSPVSPAPQGEVERKLYVATMNDGLFIIDQMPSPAPIDHTFPDRHKDTNVIAKMIGNDQEALKMAQAFVAAWNDRSALTRLRALGEQK